MNSVYNNQTTLFSDKDTRTNKNESPLQLSTVENKQVLVDFDGGQISSDAGLLLLREVEQQLGIIKQLAETINDPRDSRYVKHQVIDLLMQRVAQIAAGYEDADDCDSLRDDPIIKMFADHLPETGDPLASQPTMSRFENSITRTYLYRLAKVFVDHFIQSYEKEPTLIVLDFDDTEDITYGDQQLSLFNKYFKEYCYQPLHVYEGIGGRLVTTILKPGKRSAGKQMLGIVRRLVNYLRSYWPNTIIIFRGDAHFAFPEVMEYIEAQDRVKHVTGLTGNTALQKLVRTHIQRAKKLFKQLKRTVCLYHSLYYKAESWNKHRRVVAKVEVSDQSLNLRFIVTDLEKATANVLYSQLYCHRGRAELCIKDHKLYLKSDRTSCHRFMANQFRLFLHSAAYVLIHALKTNILRTTRWANATFATIRLKLFKIGARVRQLKTRIKVELPSSCPLKETLTKSFRIFEFLEYSQ
jgi:hypothetical protein